MKHRSVKWLVLTMLAAGTLAACSSLDSLQRQLIFRPNKSVDRTPQDAGVAFEPVAFMVQGERVTGWWIPASDRAKSGDTPAALYLHGSGFSLSANTPRILSLHKAGFDVLAIDYRGFGASEGELPSEMTSYADASAAWEELKRRAPQAPRYIYGHSLGGAIAVELATRAKDAAGLIVESSFTSVRAMQAHTAYRWIPLAPIQTQYFDSVSKLPQVCMPVLIMHGSNDYRIPTDMARELHAAAREPKKLVIVEGARHIDIPTRYTDTWSKAMQGLLGVRASACE
jgi:uncharacterized protein